MDYRVNPVYRHAQLGSDVGVRTVTAQGSSALTERAVETALRHLGARRQNDLAEVLEYAILQPESSEGEILAPLVETTSKLRDWTPAERANALLKVIEEGILHSHVSTRPRVRLALQAAFRLPTSDIAEEWRGSLSERFKQLRNTTAFGDATSIQPMEISWKHGVEQLAKYLQERFVKAWTVDDWASHRSGSSGGHSGRTQTIFRAPSEGAQKLVVSLYILTVLMQGRAESRRISERLITSQHSEGLQYYRTVALSSGGILHSPTHTPTHALWGCQAEEVCENGIPATRLWFPRPLDVGKQAYFMTEAVHQNLEHNERGWTNVYVDHYGIEAGQLNAQMIPMSGLTIRVKFDRDALPTAVWWYAEQSELERYVVPPVDSPRRLEVVSGEAAKTFEQPCQPRESYGIAYTWVNEAKPAP